jgi:hypothetical protein
MLRSTTLTTIMCVAITVAIKLISLHFHPRRLSMSSTTGGRREHNGGPVINWKSRGGGAVYAPRKPMSSRAYAVLVRDRAAAVRQQQEKKSFTRSFSLIKAV